MLNKQNHCIPPEQALALQALHSGKNLFITGGAGTGKTHLERLIESDAVKNGLRVTKAAPTGVAAEAIGGCTLHRLLCLSGSLTTVDNNGNPALVTASTKNLQKTDLLIIDEISMVSLPLFDILSDAIHTARKEGYPIQLIISGDFFQLPPVLSADEKGTVHSIYPDSDRLYAFESEYWDGFDFFTISMENHYRQDSPAFFSILSRIRCGDRSAIPELMKLTAQKPVRNALWLCGRKADAAERNKAGLEQMAGVPLVYHAVTQGLMPAADLPAPLTLEVKPLMPVIMTVNDPGGKFCNGSMGYVVSAETDCIYVSLRGRQGRIRIGRHTWKVQGVGGQELSYCQFPLAQAFALTVHKAQGLTLDAANIMPYCWDPGQLYVMLSRVTDPGRIYIEGAIPDSSLLTSTDVRAFYSGFLRPSSAIHGSLNAAGASCSGQIPSGLYRRGLRFGVYTLNFSFYGQQVSRSFIALKTSGGIWLAVTDYHRYLMPSRKIRPVTSDKGDKLYFITSFLNYLFIDSRCIDSLEELTVEMVRTFLAAYASGAYGNRKRTSQTINECINAVLQFLLSMLDDKSLDLIFTREDLFHRQYYFSRRGTLENRQALAFSIQYDADSHLILRDMPQKAAQLLLSHIYACHPDILLATALQLFAGLRPSEPLAIHEGCLRMRLDGGRILSVAIDLTKELELRKDGVKTGRIKKHRTATVYPAFIQAFNDCYERYRNACGGHAGSSHLPLCIGKDHKAMTYITYYRRFKKAVSEILPLLEADSDPDIREYAVILKDEGIAPHIWRHVFTQTLVLSGLTEAQIMAARGDSSPVSALTYLNRKSELMKQYSETAGRIADQMMEAARCYIGGDK